MTITLHTFASLKDYFPSGEEISIQNAASVQDLIEHLKGLRPEASTILDACRVAIAEQIVSYQFKLDADVEVFLIPPSSGG